MPSFLHLPSGRTLEAHGTRASRYRRSSRFTELSTDEVPIKNVMSSYPTKNDPNSLPVSSSSPAEASNQPATPPDQPTKAPDTPTNAPHATERPLLPLTLEHVESMTVSQVLAWVDNDPQRARQALDAETQGRNRVTLTSKLRRIT